MLTMSFSSEYFTSYEAKCCYKLFNPIISQLCHHSCIQLKEISQQIVSHYYLIFRNKWNIKHLLFLLTFGYHWEILYEPLCQLCWVKFTHASHVILQLILYKLWSKILLSVFQPHKLLILISKLHPARRPTPKMLSHPYLIFRNK